MTDLENDQKQVRSFYEIFIQVGFPQLKTEQGKEVSLRVNQALESVRNLIKEESKKIS